MHKNVLKTLVAAALICTMLIVPAFAEGAVVTGSEVNLRSGPGTNYRIVDCMTRGANVTVTDRSNGSWYAVDHNGVSGFMSSSYLKITEDGYIGGGETSTGNGESGYINAMYVRFRSGPGSEYSILGAYNKGKSVTVTGSSNGWTACSIDGQPGYIFSQYISYGSAPSTGGNTGGDEYGGAPNGGTAGTPEPTPTVTAAPTVTDAPGGALEEIGQPAQKPEQTEAPTVTLPPTATVTPTTAPVPTVTPVPTATPLPSVSAQPTATPAPTEAAPGHIKGDYVRFRTGPSASHSIINSYNNGKTVTITGTSGDWTACTIDGQSGYVYTQYVERDANTGIQLPTVTDAPQTTQTPTETPAVDNPQSNDGYINGNNVRMRSSPSMSAEILAELFFGNAVTITGVSGDWTAITYNGTAGFVYSQYVKEGNYSYDNSTSTSGGSAAGQEIAQFALQYVGYNYSWGGKSPSTGFDCSGLVYYVYQHFGYTLNRVAADQAMNGVHTDTLEPGDILCFYSGGSYIGHSGIYIGDGKFVHAANSTTGVIVTELSGYYSSRGYEARRIVTS